MGKGCLGQNLQGCVVVYFVIDQKSAVSMVGVFAEADVGDDQQIGGLILQFPDGALDNTVLVVGS